MKEFFGAISGLKNKTANTKVSKDYHTKLINWWSHKKHGVKRNLRKKTTKQLQRHCTNNNKVWKNPGKEIKS